MDITTRLDALRSKLRETGTDAFVARSVPNVTYLTGFDGVWDEEPSSLVMITEATATVITDSRFRDACGEAAAGGPFAITVAPGDPWLVVSELLGEKGASRLAVESSLPYSVVQHAVKVVAAEVVPLDDCVEQLRRTKDAEEIRRTEAAQAITDEAFEHILSFVAEGMSELDIALELEFYMRANGSEGVAFAPIVASGPNSALPHAHPGHRLVTKGDFLKMDFGAKVGGYRADMTRTVVIGKASDAQREIYDAVRAANQAGIDAVAAERTGVEIDAAARAVIQERGFGERFGHGLGHGVGLEIHEAPSVGPRSVGTIPAGSIITIEPGIYIPGFGGVRIEDLVVVEKGGARVLTRSPKELIEL